MTDVLTPVLTAHWDEPDSFTLAGYRREGGYQALPKALGMPPDDVIRRAEGLGAARPRRRGLPHRREVGLHPAGRRQAALPGGQRRRVRAGHLQGHPADDGQPARARSRASSSPLTRSRPTTPSSTSAARCCTWSGGCSTPSPRRTRPGYLGRDILGSGFDLDVVVHAGAGAYICGEETALLDSLEGYRGQPRLKPPFPAVAGLYACPTVVNNVESIATVPSIMADGADWFAGMGTEKSKGFGIFSLSGHVTSPGPVRGAARHHAARAAGPGGRDPGRAPAQVLDARRVVHADLHRRAPRRAARLRVGRRGRVHARHPGAADLRRDHLRGPGRAAVDRVLRARVVRQVHAVPGGHALDGPGARAAGARPGQRGRPGQARSTSATTSSAGRSARSATARPARSTPSIKYFRDEYLQHQKDGGCPFDPAAVHPVRELPMRCWSPTSAGQRR